MAHKFNLRLTKPEKLTRFDADFYKSLSTDDCIVCLTEQQIYLLGQTLEQMTWHETRWTGDKSGLDFDLISSDIQYALAETMTCETLTTLVTSIENLQQQIDFIYNQIVEDNIDPSFDVDTSVISDFYTEQELTDLGVTADACDTAGKDAIYGACKQLVSFLTNNNTDFLENLEQSIGNITEQGSTVLAAFPLTNLATLDDQADYIQFLIEELLEEYNATVDEQLIQTTICGLFCLAVNNDCNLDFNLVLDYFASKLPDNPNEAILNWASVMQFAFIGSFSGDQYFYYLCFLQLFSSLMGDGYYGTNPITAYALQLRAGMNNPDNDWSIFCLDCPPPSHPEISFGNCTVYGAAMGTLNWKEGAVWYLESEYTGTGYRATLTREGGGKFRLINVTAIEGTMPFVRTWQEFGGACDDGLDAPNPALVDLLHYGFLSTTAFKLEVRFHDID